MENTDEVAGFYKKVERYGGKYEDVYIDLRPVKYVTTDALNVLTAIIAELRHEGYHAQFRLINRPVDPLVKKVLRYSGFEKLIANANYNEDLARGGFHRRQSNQVEPIIASDLRNRPTQELFYEYDREDWYEEKLRAVYRSLIECMSNTKGHAAHDGTHVEDWWLSVYCDEEDDIAKYSFVDRGVGILASSNVQTYRKLLGKMVGEVNIKIIKDVFAGKVPSKTGYKGRGEGLPQMYADCTKSGCLDNLIIIANSVKAAVGQDSYTSLRNHFNGTFIYWELTDQKRD